MTIAAENEPVPAGATSCCSRILLGVDQTRIPRGESDMTSVPGAAMPTTASPAILQVRQRVSGRDRTNRQDVGEPGEGPTVVTPAQLIRGSSGVGRIAQRILFAVTVGSAIPAAATMTIFVHRRIADRGSQRALVDDLVGRVCRRPRGC